MTVSANFFVYLSMKCPPGACKTSSTMQQPAAIKHDLSQQQVIDAQSGYHLVLAPPGCGKTQILTERIRQAHEAQTVGYEDMLCLTFTNRAARGMRERIRTHLEEQAANGVYVGNVHRFCSKFLFEQGLIAAESSVIDDEDAVSILARYLDEDEMAVSDNSRRLHEYFEIMQLSHLMFQIARRQPRELRLHPECLNSDDLTALRVLCTIHHRPFNAEALLDIYGHADTYRDAMNSDTTDYGNQLIIIAMLKKMKFAHAFERYKEVNKLVDFEDLLILTYEALRHDPENRYRRYRWIQVDEVQDLNPLQLAIIDLLTAGEAPTVMYLGDEQQAIFSFMGAKMSTLERLKERCEGHIHHLQVNHRSPKYLLDVFNRYAEDVLHIDRALLPQPDNDAEATGNERRLLCSTTIDTEYYDVARVAQNLHEAAPEELTAIIVNANRDADAISQELHQLQVPHFKVSGQDLFATPEVKLLLAHFNLLVNEHNFMAWSRLFKGLRLFHANAAARAFVRQLFNRAITPTDFLYYDRSTYVEDFSRVYATQEIVIFDTETTGLNVFEDDIVQIAAIKIRQGEVVKGSEFTVFIRTGREIPRFLGDIENPVIKEMARHELLEHHEALRRFMQYVGNDVLLGHNAAYDYHILDHNLRRYLPSVNLREQCPKCFDSLKLVRLLEPGLKEYKLKYLLAVLHLEGENSHLADEDVDATRSVVAHCYRKAGEILPSQREFMALPGTLGHAEMLRKRYKDLYAHSKGILYERGVTAAEPILIAEMKAVYTQLAENQYVVPLEKLDYIFRFIADDLLDTAREPSLLEQLNAHLVEINTLKEADLCNSSTIPDRIFVTTVHKAKGLEFDNVIVFDAVDGRYPNYFNQNNPRLAAEDARKFYVAMTRSKKRLFISQSLTRLDYHNQPHERQLTPFMRPILHFFGS